MWPTSNRKNSGDETRKLNKQYERRRGTENAEEASDEEKKSTGRKRMQWKSCKRRMQWKSCKQRHDKQQELGERIEKDGWRKLFFELDKYSENTVKTSAMKRRRGTLITGVKTDVRNLEGVFQVSTKSGRSMWNRYSIRRELVVKRMTEDGVEKAVRTMNIWEGCENGWSVSGNGETKWTSGDQVAGEDRVCQYGSEKEISMTAEQPIVEENGRWSR